MPSTDDKEAGSTLSAESAKALANYGITRVPVDYFHIGGFRYTNLEDAIAEAKRVQKPN
jgi:hypothetical protein